MDVALLVLSYKLQVAECGVFTKQEFINGLTNLGLTNLYQLRECLPLLREYANTHFVEIYSYAFHSLKEYESQLTIPLEGALEMIRTLSVHLPHSHNFIRYMRKQNDFTGLNYDQWNMFYIFNQTITLDFENYDGNSFWPIMIDDYVAYMKNVEPCEEFEQSTSSSCNSHLFGQATMFSNGSNHDEHDFCRSLKEREDSESDGDMDVI